MEHIIEAYVLLQDEALLASWKHQLDRDAETLKMKGNLNHLRTVSISSFFGSLNAKDRLCCFYLLFGV